MQFNDQSMASGALTIRQSMTVENGPDWFLKKHHLMVLGVFLDNHSGNQEDMTMCGPSEPCRRVSAFAGAVVFTVLVPR